MADRWRSCSYLYRCLFGLHGFTRFLGESYDNAGTAWHRGVFVHTDRNSIGDVLCAPAKSLCVYTTHHGFHANHASVCVVRLTVLGLRGVPDSVREAAISFGANKWYLLTRVDLPLASPSIRAGINQTIMLSLAMVVVASLIGAKGLGEDVLEALQYANVGQGILAGFAILFCAMILDRLVQGARKS